MEIWRIVETLGYFYRLRSFGELDIIASENFQYISDFENISPLDREQYKKYMETQLEKFYHPHSLEIIERRYCKKMIEIVFQNNFPSNESYDYLHLFTEPRLLQCEIENGKICKMHLCSPDNQKIPDNIQTALLESCKNNDFNAAQKAIENGAYAGTCYDNSRSCLEYAAETGSVELCKLLIDDEAEYKYGTGWQSVFYAVKNPDVEVLKYFLTLDIILDSVSDFVEDNRPMTILDYAEYLNNEAAVEILQKIGVPTFQELKDWCFLSAKLKIRISEKDIHGDDMTFYAVCEDINYWEYHTGKSDMCLGMELDDCCKLVIPFFLEYFQNPFEEYLEDNLVTFEDAEKALAEIHNFCELLTNDFDNPKVQKILDKTSPTSYIDWEGHNMLISFHFSRAEEKLLWKAKKKYLIDFYQKFCRKFEMMLIKGEEAGDCYITFVGP
jgi:hypothetical protein